MISRDIIRPVAVLVLVSGPIHVPPGPIQKHDRTLISPIPPNPCTEHPIPKPQTHTVDYILVQIMFTVVYILTYEFRK